MNPGGPCRVALLGCGAISEMAYAPALRELEAEGGAKLAVIFEPNAERAAIFAKLFPGAVLYRDESFFVKEKLDLAIVATPVSFHAALTIYAVKSGVAVLCEKPMAANLAEATGMLEAAKGHGQILAVGLMRRFYANVAYTRQVIESGTLGAVKSFTMQEGGPFGWPAKSDSFFRRKTAGGGVLLDIGVHVLDLVVHWFGEPEMMHYADDAMGGLETNCEIELVYSTGMKGSVRLSRDWETANEYVIEFEHGRLRLGAGDAEGVELIFKDASGKIEGRTTEVSVGRGIAAATYFQAAFVAQLRDVIGAVQEGGKPSVPAAEGIRSLRLIEQCYATRGLMEMPWLTRDEWGTGLAMATGERA